MVAIKTVFAGQHVARIGGEEFGLIVDVNNFSESSALLDKFMQSLNEQTVAYNSETIKVTASIGATYELKENLNETLKVADEHLF